MPEMHTKFTVKGTQFGVRVEPRGTADPHACFQIVSEDDEYWSDTAAGASMYWIDDLIKVLEEAKRLCKKTLIKDRNGYGYEF